jgi:hypothetical protein
MRLRALLTCLLVAGCRKGALEARADDAAIADSSRAAETAAAVASIGMAPSPPMAPVSGSPSLAPSPSGVLASPCLPVPAGMQPGPKVDLDGDGQLDAITMIEPGVWALYVVHRACGVAMGRLRGSEIVVNRGSSNGMRDVVTSEPTLHPGCDRDHYLWQWNGTSYVKRGEWMTKCPFLPGE